MPSPTTERSVVEVPDAAVEAATRAAFVPPVTDDRRSDMRAALAAALPSLEEDFKERARPLWEAMTELWDDPDEMRDSACAYPGTPIKGKKLYRIGVDLGFIEEAEQS